MSKEIIERLIRLMTYAGQLETLTGEEKKKFVLLKLKDELELEPILEEVIIQVIDLLIDVEKGKLKFNKEILKRVGFCFPCC